MDYTTNYHLPQWVESDRIMMEDFNEAMAAIEKGLTDGKNDLKAGMEQAQTQLETLSAALGSGGKNARIQWGTYEGRGASSQSDPTRITCSFAPAVVFIHYNAYGGYGSIVLIRDEARYVVDTFNHYAVLLSWSDTDVSFYPEKQEAGPLYDQATYTYHYLALGYDSGNV